jgi:hypothetical protein
MRSNVIIIARSLVLSALATSAAIAMPTMANAATSHQITIRAAAGVGSVAFNVNPNSSSNKCFSVQSGQWKDTGVFADEGTANILYAYGDSNCHTSATVYLFGIPKNLTTQKFWFDASNSGRG